MKSKFIDHTVLKANTTLETVKQICKEARENDFASVCINPTFVSEVAKMLEGTDVKVCTVIGFPLGANTIATKAFETKNAVENGADEIDMVINVGKAKDGDFDYIEEEIKAVVEASGDKLVKVIIETCYLSDEEKIEICKRSVKAGANFVKTSTGFGTGGATVEDVALMRKTVGEKTGVKASGGVRTAEDFEKMVNAGATRIGTSNGVTLLQGKESKSDY